MIEMTYEEAVEISRAAIAPVQLEDIPTALRAQVIAGTLKIVETMQLRGWRVSRSLAEVGVKAR